MVSLTSTVTLEHVTADYLGVRAKPSLHLSVTHPTPPLGSVPQRSPPPPIYLKEPSRPWTAPCLVLLFIILLFIVS